MHGQLSVANPGERYVHIPAALRGAWPDPGRLSAPPHKWFAQLTAEQRDGQGRWDRKVSGAPNEVWDLFVMTQVLAHLHASRIDWRMPPVWAAEWDHNGGVRAGIESVPAVLAVPGPMHLPATPAYVPRGRSAVAATSAAPRTGQSIAMRLA